MVSLEAHRANIESVVSKARHIQGINQFCGRNSSCKLFPDTLDSFYFVSVQYMA